MRPLGSNSPNHTATTPCSSLWLSNSLVHNWPFHLFRAFSYFYGLYRCCSSHRTTTLCFDSLRYLPGRPPVNLGGVFPPPSQFTTPGRSRAGQRFAPPPTPSYRTTPVPLIGFCICIVRSIVVLDATTPGPIPSHP